LVAGDGCVAERFVEPPRGANDYGGGAQVGAGSAEGPRILLAHGGMASSGGDVLSAVAQCCLLKANVAGGGVAKSGPGRPLRNRSYGCWGDLG
jgi:hypothetical protein